MKKSSQSSGNCLGITIGVIVALLGIAGGIVTLPTVIGPMIGALMVLAGLLMGGRRQKIWKCRTCGAFIPRA